MPDNTTNGKWFNPAVFSIEDGETRRAFDDLTRYLGGWVDDSGRNPIVQSNGNENRGNAIVLSYYRVTGDICSWYGHYQLGNTTVWTGGAGNILLVPPVAMHSHFGTIGSMPISTFRAFNGTFNFGHGEMTSPSTITLFDSAVANTPWNVTAAKPFAWGANNILSWNIEFRIDHRVRQ